MSPPLRLAGCALAVVAAACQQEAVPPNIVLVLADDLGVAELGCYGQQKIRTPNIDRLAVDGMRFSAHYAGSCVCAPSRCTLLTGRHTGHAQVRGNYRLDPEKEGQYPLAPGTDTIGTMLKAAGYQTAAIGKWGLGGPGSTGAPERQGFDRFFGYLCQAQAHNYYPDHLWRDGERVELDNAPFSAHQKLGEAPADDGAFGRFAGQEYAPDLMLDEALGFIRENRDRRFFLYYATPVPHAAIQVPNDSLAEYAGRLDDGPYLGQKGYLPHAEPRAGYAAMVTRLDRDVGRILALLDELDLAENTLVLFTSDNGPTFNGGTDSEFFDSTGGLRGLKCSLYEGGIRAPLIARWPGRIAAGSSSDHVSAFWDVLPTLAELTGQDAPDDIDGISFLPALLGRPNQPVHESLYWEYPAAGGIQAVRLGRYKAVRRGVRRFPDRPTELYDIEADPFEQVDVASGHPEIVEVVDAIFASRSPSTVERWNYEPRPR